MSIVVCIPGTNGIMFYSDGVAYDEDGTILGMASKVLPVAGGTAALSWVGAGSFGPAIASRIGPPICTFDSLIEHVVNFGREAVDYLIATNYRWHVSGTAIVAGWSEKDQAFRAFTFSSYDKDQRRFEGELVVKPAWELQPLEGMYASTIPAQAHLQAAGIDDLYDTTMPLDELGIRLVCAARLGSHEFEPGEKPVPGSSMSAFAAGGFLQQTFVARDQFSQAIIHRWPEQIGEKIDPAAGEAVPIFLTERQPEPTAQ